MRTFFYLFVVLMTGLLFASCKKDNISHNFDFLKSHAAWASFKASTGNSYRYTVEFGSWTGTSSQTTITVESGKITGRSFVLKAIDNTLNQPVVVAEWEEDESMLNQHTQGFHPITLDEIYEQAKTDWLVKRKGTTTYFETNNNGMISLCGYTSLACADDCFTGIHISSIERL